MKKKSCVDVDVAANSLTVEFASADFANLPPTHTVKRGLFLTMYVCMYVRVHMYVYVGMYVHTLCVWGVNEISRDFHFRWCANL